MFLKFLKNLRDEYSQCPCPPLVNGPPQPPWISLPWWMFTVDQVSAVVIEISHIHKHIA